MSYDSEKMLKGCIVGTIGPKSETPDILENMITAGLRLVRINLSHGSQNDAKHRFETVRSVNDEIPIMFDLSGPKIRIDDLEESVSLQKDQEFILQTKKIVGDATRASFSYPELVKLVKPKDKLFLNDGLIELEVVKANNNSILTTVTKPGPLSSRKGINTPGIPITLFPPTKKDISDLEFTSKLEPDFYSVSFVRRPEDLNKVRELLSSELKKIPDLISKIEHQDALKDIDSIIKASDAVMVARGDLGVEIDPSLVPLVQKQMIKKCNFTGTPVIVATQMLESMVFSPRPTRAEASDVANAILDGADGVMLSAETATGQYPVNSVQTMANIIRNVQTSVEPVDHKLEPGKKIPPWDSIARSAVLLAEMMDAKAIIANTKSGRTSRVVSKYRPKQPIISVTNNLLVYRQLHLQWGVIPIYTHRTFTDTDSMIYNSIVSSFRKNILEEEDLVIVIAGSMMGLPTNANLIQFYKVSDIISSERAKEKFSKVYVFNDFY
jgi:pyruvate kinase